MHEIDPKQISLSPSTLFANDWLLLSAGTKEKGWNTMTISWGHLGAIWGTKAECRQRSYMCVPNAIPNILWILTNTLHFVLFPINTKRSRVLRLAFWKRGR